MDDHRRQHEFHLILPKLVLVTGSFVILRFSERWYFRNLSYERQQSSDCEHCVCKSN